MTRSFVTVALLAALAPAVTGCALLTKSDPLTARYFSPEPWGSSAAPATSTRAAAPGRAVRELRLGRVTAAAYLGERLVFRDSDYELGFREDLRWSEKPEVYLRRALSRAFFEDGGFRRVVSGASSTVEVELVEFTEIIKPSHVARVRAYYVLYDTRSVQREATVSVDLPIPAQVGVTRAPAAVPVLADGLARVVNRIVEEVAAHLDAPSSGAGALVAQ